MGHRKQSKNNPDYTQRIDERFKITNKTKTFFRSRVLKAKYISHSKSIKKLVFYFDEAALSPKSRFSKKKMYFHF